MRRVALVLCVVLAAAVWAVADPVSGVRAWLALDRDRTAAEARLLELRGELAALEAQADALDADALAIEMAIRTDLGLARPGETIVRVVSPPAAADKGGGAAR